MTKFLNLPIKPAEPCLDVYELDRREPCVRIDQLGQIWLLETVHLPKVLFADVPVMIHTAYGFSLAPLSEANDQTGPER